MQSFDAETETMIIMLPNDEVPDLNNVIFENTSGGLNTLLHYEHSDGSIETLAQFVTSDLAFDPQRLPVFDIQFVSIDTYAHLQLNNEEPFIEP